MKPDLHEQTWYYLAEGHLNLVLTNKRGLSLRCRKKTNAQTYEPPDVEKTFFFINTVVKKLLPPEFMPDVQIIELNEKLSKCFPEDVLDRIDTDQKYCLLMEDCSHLMSDDEIISLEIKPKCGVLFDENKSEAYCCRFCLQQRLKLYNKRVKEISSFCPMDFYSKDKERFKKSIEGLITTPHNNLRIFSNGQVVYDESTKFEDKNKKLELVRNSLGIENRDQFSELLYHIIMQKEGKLIKTILKLQSHDTLGSSGAYEIFQSLASEERRNFTDIDKNFWSSVVENIEKTSESKLVALAKYFISLTFKDCSLLLTIQRTDSQHETKRAEIIKFDNQTWMVKRSIVDFDPKPLNKIEKYKQLHDDILKINGLDEIVLI